MLSQHSSVPLPALVSHANLEFVLKEYESKLGYFSRLRNMSKPLDKFINDLKTKQVSSVLLDQQQLFELAKVLYDIELYDDIHKKNTAASKVITQFVDNVFGKARSTGFRMLYANYFKSLYLDFEY